MQMESLKLGFFFYIIKPSNVKEGYLPRKRSDCPLICEQSAVDATLKTNKQTNSLCFSSQNPTQIVHLEEEKRSCVVTFNKGKYTMIGERGGVGGGGRWLLQLTLNKLKPFFFSFYNSGIVTTVLHNKGKEC
jgi:hypothetical protein